MVRGEQDGKIKLGLGVTGPDLIFEFDYGGSVAAFVAGGWVELVNVGVGS